MKVSARQHAAPPEPSPARPAPEGACIRAILGPTNTGKTHLALERMLAHDSGIIGFPLRLLARENYERMVQAKGVRAVALITGEEKIIPPHARWFSCTVEAMPTTPLPGNQPVDFVAVDEIQLCADPERGHIFTDRLLNARGAAETLFLGADTIAPLLKTLIPHIEIDTRPRLSALSGVGHNRLSRLPPRSAIVAFSVAEVYAIAELIRRKRGGCAVVMGQLSPRTRNAQVALYQNREVDYLVATDAIGMGLNMDIHHVAFAGLSKFDGQRHRLLSAAEVAQIAGRAGRGARDGTFGTTGTCPPLNETMVEAVEEHRFDPLQSLWWRNSALDFSSLTALHASLCRKPPMRCLRPAEPAADMLCLHAFMQDSSIKALANTPNLVRLLWEVCQIPDFRKLGEDSHIRQCAQIFTLLARRGNLPSDWLGARLHGMDSTEGDLDSLMQRLMGIRIWSYVAARSDWVENAAHWQRHTRRLEDTLSDALHDRLTARFVDRRAASLARRLEESDGKPLLSAMSRTGEIIVEGHTVGHMRGFAFAPDAEAARMDQPLILRAARRAARTEMPHLVARFAQADDTELTLDTETGILSWQGEAVASLRSGLSVLQPDIAVRDAEFLDAGQKEKIRARLARFVTALIRHELAPLFRAEAAVQAHPLPRGLVHSLMEQGGVTPCPLLPPLSSVEKKLLARLHILHTRDVLFCSRLLRPAPMALRRLLLGIHQQTTLPSLPPAGAVCVLCAMPPSLSDQAAYLSLGWLYAAQTLLRLDRVADIRADMESLARKSAKPAPANLASRLGVTKKALPVILKALGIRLYPP
ncbi:MAG: helicase-related protein, partial [Acetobacter papayae]